MTSLQMVAKNYTIQTIGKMLTVLVGIFAVAIIARSLGKEGIGAYTTAMTYLTIFGTIVEFGMTLTLIQMISIRDQTKEARVINSLLGLRVVSGLLFYSLAPILVQIFPYSPATKLAVVVGTLGYFFMTSTGLLIGFFQKHLIIWRFALSELLNRGFFLLLVIFFTWLGFKTVGMVAAFAIANILWFIAVFFLIRPYIKIRPSFDKDLWKEAFHRSWPIGLSTICNLVYLKGDIMFLAAFRSEAVVGIYGIAYKIIDVVTMIPVMLMGLLLPSLTLLWKEQNKADFARFLQKAFDFFMILAIPIVFGAQAVATPLSVLIGGDEFVDSGPILRILIIATLGLFISSLYGHTVVAIEKQKSMAPGYALTAFLTIIGYLIFIPRFGVWGAAGMTLFSEFLIGVLTFIMVVRTTHIYPNLLVLFKVLLASIIMYVFLMFLPAWPVLLQITLGTLFYILILLSIGGVKFITIKSLFYKQTG